MWLYKVCYARNVHYQSNDNIYNITTMLAYEQEFSDYLKYILIDLNNLNWRYTLDLTFKTWKDVTTWIDVTKWWWIQLLLCGPKSNNNPIQCLHRRELACWVFSHRDVDDVIRDVLLQLEEENATAAANFIDVVAHEIIRRHIR